MWYGVTWLCKTCSIQTSELEFTNYSSTVWYIKCSEERKSENHKTVGSVIILAPCTLHSWTDWTIKPSDWLRVPFTQRFTACKVAVNTVKELLGARMSYSAFMKTHQQKREGCSFVLQLQLQYQPDTKSTAGRNTHLAQFFKSKFYKSTNPIRSIKKKKKKTRN